MKLTKKDIIYSLIIGEVSSWFFIFIVKNPYIEEFKSIGLSPVIIWSLPIVFPVVFLIGTFIAKLLSKLAKVIYQIARFAEVGVMNTFIDFGILNLLIWITRITGGLAIAPLNAFSFLCATSNSYFWNKFWTFSSSGEKKVSGKEFTQFLIISAIGITINTGIVVLGTSLIVPWFSLSAGAWANVMKLLATFISMVWNFLGYKFIVFKK